MGAAIEVRMLERGDCLRRLAGGGIGRVVYTDSAMPAIQPVNYFLDGEEIIFRTEDDSKLVIATRHAIVAFEVDDINGQTRTGWSVVGIGEAYEIVDPTRLAELAAKLPQSWTTYPGAHTVSIPLQVLTGRNLVLAGGIAGCLSTRPA
jgi:nitroimidazol reductase NimA-like FMN-containing flavoprotein (pyridoxamine 5'-phosphate oxidase superfamily)